MTLTDEQTNMCEYMSSVVYSVIYFEALIRSF